MNGYLGIYRDIICEHQEIPVYLLLFVLTVGIFYAFFSDFESDYSEHLTAYLKQPKQEDIFFIRAGIKLSANQYRLLLFGFTITIFLLNGFRAVSVGSYSGLIKSAAYSLLFLYLFMPRIYLYKGIRSPFIIIIDYIALQRSKEMDYEIYSSVTMLKNLATAQEKHPLSFDLMMERLMESSRKLKSIYQRTLGIYRADNLEKAMRHFTDAVGTKNAKSFALILEKIDKINPTELKNQVSVFQETLSEEMFTRGLEKAEGRGTIVYALATMVSFICLLNFIFVSVLMDTLETLGDIF